MNAPVAGLGGAYSIEVWFWNGLPADARPVAGYLFSRGVGGADGAPGDHLAIGGTAGHQGRLVFFNGNVLNQALAGRTEIPLRTWHHLVFIRDGKKVAVHLDGGREPEISGEAEVAPRSATESLFVGGRNDGFASFEGKMDEVSVYDRALTSEEVALHRRTSDPDR